MTDNNWTPGPWALSRYHYPHRDIVQRTGSEDNDARPGGRHICAVSARDKSEQCANAHLIAAAQMEAYSYLHDLAHMGYRVEIDTDGIRAWYD